MNGSKTCYADKTVVVMALIDANGGQCPQCGSECGLKYPRGLEPYCEDCGWPDSDFDKEGDALGANK